MIVDRDYFFHFNFLYKNVMLQLILHFAFHFLVKLQIYNIFLLISIMKVLLRTEEHQKFVCKNASKSESIKCFILSFDEKLRKLKLIQMKLYFPGEPPLFQSFSFMEST